MILARFCVVMKAYSGSTYRFGIGKSLLWLLLLEMSIVEEIYTIPTQNIFARNKKSNIFVCLLGDLLGFQCLLLTLWDSI